MHDELIYLDGFATTPLAPEARRALIAASAYPGNASSPHLSGARASAALDRARDEVASLIGADPGEMVFTSGATEANNLAVRGVALGALKVGSPRRKIVVSSIEHKAVLDAADSLRDFGFKVAHAPVSADGVVDIEMIKRLVDTDTLLVSIMLANNETGAIQPVGLVSAIAHRHGALMHCDAAQGVGKVSVDVDDLGVDYMSVSAHKMYGPMGVGALFIATGAPKPAPIIFGGGQERAMRPGTEPIYLLAGFGAAARLAKDRLQIDMKHTRALADAFRRALEESGLAFKVTTGDVDVLPGSVSIYVSGASADSIVSSMAAKFSLSTGSACNSGQIFPSHVLTSMGIDSHSAKSILRLYFGRYNTIEDVHKATPSFIKAVNRQLTPLDDAASPM